jgi:hypothetical protein
MAFETKIIEMPSGAKREVRADINDYTPAERREIRKIRKVYPRMSIRRAHLIAQQGRDY